MYVNRFKNQVSNMNSYFKIVKRNYHKIVIFNSFIFFFLQSHDALKYKTRDVTFIRFS